MFERWWALVQANPSINTSNVFVALIWSSYFDRQVMAIRRQIKDKKESVSLVRLLKDIAEHDTFLTRDDFLKGYSLEDPVFPKKTLREARRQASRVFDSFSGRARPRVSRQRVERDIKRLKRASHRLEYFADKWLAHSDRKRRWPRLNFRELNKVLDLLDDIWHRYHYLARGGPIDTDPEFLAGSEWEEVLEIPWKYDSVHRKK